jgi:integrase
MKDFGGQKEINHMKGSIIKRGNSYSGAVYVGRNENGIKKYKWVSAPSRQEVKVKLAELKHSVMAGTYIAPKGTLAEFAQRWLKEYAEPKLAPRTVDGYRSIFNSGIGPAMGKVLLRDLKPDRIQRYYADKLATGVSNTTVTHHAMVLHRILEFAVKWQLLARNPADAASPPGIRHIEMHILDEEQVVVFLNAAIDTPYFTEFHLALFTGMRRSEIMALRWQDCDLILAGISVSRSMHQLYDRQIVFSGTKTAKSSRRIELSPETCQVLRLHLENEMSLCARLGVPFTNDRLLFCEWDGRPLSPDRVSRAWEQLIKKLEFGHIRFHDARHTHASLLLKAGIHPKIVQERLGHANIQTTLNIYSHVMPGMQRRAAEAFEEMISNYSVHEGLADRISRPDRISNRVVEDHRN